MTSKRIECKRCGISGHVAKKCSKPEWWRRNEMLSPKRAGVIPAQIKGDK